MTGPRFLLVILLLVAGTFFAIYYTNSLYDKRASDLLDAMGENRRPQSRPMSRAASAPSTRPALRAEEVVTLLASDRTRVVSVRANGEFLRLPSSPAELGPIVRGNIGRVAASAMKSAAPPPESLRLLRGQQMRADAMPERTTMEVTPIEGTVPEDAIAWPRSYGIPVEGGAIEVPVVVPAARAFLMKVRVGSIIHLQNRAYRVTKIELLAP